MKINRKAPISEAIKEVWEWNEKRNYYEQSLKKAVKMLKGRLETNPDGSYSIVKQ